MGNTQGREHRSPPLNHPNAHAPQQNTYTAADGTVYTTRVARTSHGNLFGRSGMREEPQDEAGLAQRRLNKAEREARKKEEKEAARKRERERSMREESVDGGFLISSGLYISDEDYNKSVVRQLMIERRLAPFYTGLEDHRETWTEHQLIAAVHGLEVPPADEAPSGVPHWPPADGPIQSSPSSAEPDPPASPSDIPIPPSMSSSSPFGSSSILRSRARTSSSLNTSAHGDSILQQLQTQLDPQPLINGQRMEVFLYKEPAECEICYRSLPPYTNRSRCCDKPICSECFVSIKRKDPHPVETEDGLPGEENRPKPPVNPNPESEFDLSEIDLVSEPAKCPFCKENEFGITYQPPPFRSGLVYPNAHGVTHPSSLLSRSSTGSSTPTGSGRPRAASLPANASGVVTTDRIRPDWARKLLQAKLNVAKRARAATALHQQAFLPAASRSRLGIFRRGTSEGNISTEEGTDNEGTPLDINRLIAAADRRMAEDGVMGPIAAGPRGVHRTYQAYSIEAQYEEALQRALRESVEDEQRRAAKAEKERQEEEKRKQKEESKRAKEEAKRQKQADKAAKKSSSLLNFPRAMRSTTSIVSTDQHSSISNESSRGKGPASGLFDAGSGLTAARSRSNTYLDGAGSSSSRPSSPSIHRTESAGKAPESGTGSLHTRSTSQTNFSSLNAMVENPDENKKSVDGDADSGGLDSFSKDMLSSMDNIMTGGEASKANVADDTETSKATAVVNGNSPLQNGSEKHHVELANNATARAYGSV